MIKPRFSLTTQIYLAVCVLVAALVLTAGLAWLDAGQQARSRFERELSDGLDVFKADFDRATVDLIALGNWLVTQKNFSDLVQARDRGGLAHYLEAWSEISIADGIVVVDRDGKFLAQVKGNSIPTQTDSVRSTPGVVEALAGKRTTSVELDSVGRLQQQITLPIYSAESSSPAGALILSFYLDGAFLQYRSRKLDQDIAIVHQEHLVILTLTDSQGKPFQSAVTSPLIVKAQRDGRPSEFIEVDTAIGKELFRFRPLDAAVTSGSALYGVGVSLAAIDNERSSVFRTVWVGLGIIALGAGLAAFLFVRALTAPIHALDRAAQKIASGDLSGEIELAQNDELGDLARQMEIMRRQLGEAFQAATTERNRYAAVIQSMGVATVITDNNLTIAAANLAAQSLLEQDAARLMGQSLNQILANGKDGNSKSVAWSLADAREDQGLVARGRFHLRTNPRAMLEILSTPVQINGAPAGYVHVLHDAAAEEQIVRVKDEFLMNAAHELRGPLASLRASIELLVDDFAEMSRPDLGLMLRTMQRSVLKFQGLVENLVDVGNIQAGNFRVRPAPNRVQDLIQDALTQTHAMVQARQQTLETKFDCTLPCLVSADRGRIMQVLINLITNASKYGPENEPILICVSTQDQMVMIEVEDRGQGIPLEEQENLFKRFYRGRRAEEEGIGIGLGLALAREIVTAHGGQIGVKSGVGKGTTFWFSLPMVK